METSGERETKDFSDASEYEERRDHGGREFDAEEGMEGSDGGVDGCVGGWRRRSSAAWTERGGEGEVRTEDGRRIEGVRGRRRRRGREVDIRIVHGRSEGGLLGEEEEELDVGECSVCRRACERETWGKTEELRERRGGMDRGEVGLGERGGSGGGMERVRECTNTSN